MITTEDATKSKAQTQARGRGPKGRAYCWQHKDAIWQIRRGFNELSYLKDALAIYLVHTELASDAQEPSYTALRRKIAERAGVSIRRVTDVHNRLKALMILEWRQQEIPGTKELGENVYTLLMPGTVCPTSGKEQKRDICPVTKQFYKQSLNERYNVAGSLPASGATAGAETAPDSVQRSKQASEIAEARLLTARVRKMLGDDEWQTHDGQWCTRIQKYPAEVRKALDIVSDDLEKRKQIDNRASYLTGILKNLGCDLTAENIPGPSK